MLIYSASIRFILLFHLNSVTIIKVNILRLQILKLKRSYKHKEKKDFESVWPKSDWDLYIDSVQKKYFKNVQNLISEISSWKQNKCPGQ